MKHDIRTLAELHFRKVRRWMPFAPGCDWKRVAQNQGVFLVLSLILFRNIPDLAHLYVQWTLWLLVAIMILSGTTSMGTFSREWELTIPRPRMHLMMGWFVGSLRVALHMMVYWEATVLLHYGVGLITHRMSPLSPGSGLETVAVFTAFALAALVPAIGLKTLFLIFSRGWAGVVGPWFLMLGLMMGTQLWEIVVWTAPFSLETITIVMIGVIAFGWPLTWGVLRLAANVGLRRLGDMRLQEASFIFARGSARHKASAQQRQRRNPRPPDPTDFQTVSKRHSTFWSLFRLEMKRRLIIGGGAGARLLLFTAGVLVLAAAGFVTADRPPLFTKWAITVYLIIYFVFIPRALGSAGEPMTQGWGGWWLSIPGPRWVLTGSRGLALWSAFLLVSSATAGSLLMGATLKGIGGSAVSLWTLGMGVGKIWFGALILFTVNFLLMHIAPALRGWLGFLLLPLYALIFWSPFGVERSGDPWRILGLYATLGLPAGLIAFAIGSYFLNSLASLEGVRSRMRKMSP